MTRIKSFAHGIKEYATPYEVPHTTKSVHHRIHRSKKNQQKGGYKRRKQRIAKKEMIERLKLEELEEEKLSTFAIFDKVYDIM